MNDNNNNKKPGLQIKISPELADGVYVNLCVIAHSRTEFVVDCISVMPNKPTADVKSRLILAPEHAKRLMLALQDNVAKYERENGQIELGEQMPLGSKDIMMPLNGGDA